MRTRWSTSLAIFALALTDVFSLALSLRNPSRPEPLPPEITSRPLRRVPPAKNITIPSPPSTTPSTPPSPVPTPMDLSISYALSDSCLLYLSSVLSSSTFESCLPFSLLLTTSTSYASLLSDSLASGDLSTLNELIAYTASPQPSISQCDNYFSGVLSGLTAKGNCANDLVKGKGNQVAKEMKAGVGAYKMMREAEKLTDPDTGNYCYLQAVAASTPNDLYLWSLPAGVSLPASSIPTCSKCSSLLLNHYAESLDDTPTLNGTLLQTAINRVNAQCGPAFATYTASSRTGSASAVLSTSWLIVVVITGAMGVMSFV